MQEFQEAQRTTVEKRLNKYVDTLWPVAVGNGKSIPTELAVQRFLERCFIESKNRNELARLQKEKNFIDVISGELKHKNQTNLRTSKTSNATAASISDVKSILRRLFDKSDLAPQAPASIPSARDTDLTDPKKIQDYQKRAPVELPNERGDYSDFYRRMKEMAADKGLSEKDLQELLKDRARGEKAFELWRAKRDRTVRPNLIDSQSKLDPVAKRLYVQDVDMRRERHKIYQNMKEERQDQELEQYANLQENRLAQHGDIIRSVDQFMADQMSFEQRKVRKIQEAAHRQEVDNLQPHHPEINEKSQEIIDKRRRQAAWEGTSITSAPKGGLTLETATPAISSKTKQRKLNALGRSEYSFSPRINSMSKKLNGRGLNDLHEDTQRRMARQQEYLVQQQQVEKVSKHQISSISDKLVHDRFEQDFGAACRELELTDGAIGKPIKTDIRISCATMSQMLLRLGFVNRSLKQSEQLLLADIWRKTGGDAEGQGQVPLVNLKNFLRAIQNFHHQELLDVEREADPAAYERNGLIGRHTGAGLLFTAEEIESITKMYRELYRNRQDKLAERHTARFMAGAQEAMATETYRPKVLKKSTTIAQKRYSVPYSAGYSPRIEHRLLQQKAVLDGKKEALVQEAEAQRQRETPFHPQLPQERLARNTVKHQREKEPYGDQWTYLHEVGKRAMESRPDDVPTDIREFEKNRLEYTFSPNKHRAAPDHQRRDGYMEPLKRDCKASPSPRRRQGGVSPVRRQSALAADDHFMINVNIGAQTKVILATLRSDPMQLSKNFLRCNGFDEKYAGTLQKIIDQHQANLRDAY